MELSDIFAYILGSVMTIAGILFIFFMFYIQNRILKELKEENDAMEDTIKYYRQQLKDNESLHIRQMNELRAEIRLLKSDIRVIEAVVNRLEFTKNK